MLSRMPSRCLQFALFTLVLISPNSFSQNAACSNNLCNLAADGAYEHFIIGELVHVASDAEFNEVFQQAKAQQKWQHLPNDFSYYQQSVKLVSIKFHKDNAPVSVFLTRNEYQAAPFELGALVRYRPHNNDWEAPQNREERALFYGLTGCVATLCAKSDKDCQRRYPTGVFNLQGHPLDFISNQKLNNQTSIDPISLLPRMEAH